MAGKRMNLSKIESAKVASLRVSFLDANCCMFWFIPLSSWLENGFQSPNSKLPELAPFEGSEP